MIVTLTPNPSVDLTLAVEEEFALLDPETLDDFAYMARELVQATLPHRNPGDVPARVSWRTAPAGRTLEWFLTGFSPRKQDLTLYIMPGVERYPSLMKKLGKHKTGKSCLYIKKLEDVDLSTLKQLIKQSVADFAKLKK